MQVCVCARGCARSSCECSHERSCSRWGLWASLERVPSESGVVRVGAVLAMVFVADSCQSSCREGSVSELLRVESLEVGSVAFLFVPRQ